MDPESVLSTSSSGSDNISVVKPHSQFIDLYDYNAPNDPGGWNSHCKLQSSSFGTRNEDWNRVTFFTTASSFGHYYFT